MNIILFNRSVCSAEYLKLRLFFFLLKNRVKKHLLPLDLELKENLISHDAAIKKWRNFRAAPVPQRFLPQQPQQRRFMPPGRAPLIRPGPLGGRAVPPQQQQAAATAVPGRQNVGFVKVRLPMLSTNGKRPVVELVMLTNGKYQPIKFTNNRQVEIGCYFS
jgi:hypothetical protein